jgi:hypothetical protein
MFQGNNRLLWYLHQWLLNIISFLYNCTCAQVALVLLDSSVVRLGSQRVKMATFQAQNLPKWNHQVNADIQRPWHNHHYQQSTTVEPSKTSVQPLRGSVPECSQGIIMLPNNAHPHVASTIQNTMCSMCWTIPNTAQTCQHIICMCSTSQKKAMKGCRFRPDEDIKPMKMQWLKQQPWVLCRWDSSAGASVGWLSQCPLGLFLMVSLLHPQ